MFNQLTIMLKYESYKNSSVEWLGEVPEHWDTKKIKRCSKISSGDAIVNNELSDIGSYEVFGGNGFMGYVGKYNVDGDKIIIGRVGAYCGNIRFINEKKWISDNALILTLNKGENYSFFTYILNAANLNELNASNAQPLITGNKIMNFFLVLPPKKEQTAIATFLDRKTTQIDEAISIKQKQIDLLKERKQILIQNAVTRGLNPNTPMRDSGVEWIGEIPAHWEIKKLRFLGGTQNGISAGAEYFGSGYPFVSYGDVYNNRELPALVKGLAKSSDKDRKQYSIEKGDVLFTRTSETVEEIGFASTCLKTIKNSTFAGFLIRFRPKTENLFVGFSKYYFNAPMLREYFVKEMNLVIRASLSQELLKNLPVLLPPLDEQQDIYSHIKNESTKIDKAITLQQQQIEKLKEYKATLINSAVTGKIKVPLSKTKPLEGPA